MLSKFKRNKHQQHLAQLPKISQSVDDVDFFYAPADFRETLLEKIASAKQRICIVALYLEQDDGGKGILDALYAAKRQRPELDVRVLVDWHRAQRGRIGAAASNTNADWYCRMAQENPGIDIPVYGVPINTREALGVLHFKGFIIDDCVLYSGASLNDVYLARHGRPLTPEDLQQHDCLLYLQQSRVYDKWRLGNRTVQVRGPLVSDDADVIRRLAIQGEGIVYKSWLDVSANIAAGELEIVLPELLGEPTPVTLVCPHRKQLTPAVSQLHLWLRERFEALRDRALTNGCTIVPD